MEHLKTVAEIVAGEPQYAGLKERLPNLVPRYRADGTLVCGDRRASWLQASNVQMLQILTDSLKPKRVLEVGSWMGASACFLASLPSVESVICVDHWDRNLIENYVPGQVPEEWLDEMYAHFLANILHAPDRAPPPGALCAPGTPLASIIRPLRMASQDAAKWLRDEGVSPFDLVYIDAAHKTELAYADLVAYRPFVRKGGILAGDDWAHNLPGEDVRGAVERYAGEAGGTAIGFGNCWWINF